LSENDNQLRLVEVSHAMNQSWLLMFAIMRTCN